MPKRFFLFLLFFFLILWLPEKALAGCNIGGSSSTSCCCGNGECVNVSPCCDPGSDNGTRWESCGTDSNNYCVVKNRCAGSTNDPPDPASCFHKTCGGNECQRGAYVDCSQRNNLGQYGGTSWEWACKQNAPNCDWDRVPNEDVGRCSGHSCTQSGKCTDSPADYNCEGLGCTLIYTDTTNICKGACTYPSGGGTCGYATCPNECGGFPNCGYIACSTPAPTATPTPTPSPTPTPTPFPAWFQTAGGDVHANGRLGTTIPNTCGTVCSIGNFLSKILNAIRL